MPDGPLQAFRMQASSDDDASLVRAAQRDPTAFGALFRRYVSRIYRYLYSRVGNAADAEDLTAQVSTEALEGLANYIERGTFAAWLFTIARHKVADHHRRFRPHLPLDEAQHNPGEQVHPLADLVREEELKRLAVLVAQLDEEQQELLRLRFAVGLTYGQVAAVVGRSEAAIKMGMHRLLRGLQADWEGTDE